MGNIQNISCSDINCFDNTYEMDWFSEKSWNISHRYINFNPKNSYKIEKGTFFILNSSKCLFYLSKKIMSSNDIYKLIFNLNFEYVLTHSNQIECSFFLSKNKIDNIFDNTQKINKTISILTINQNNIYIENKILNKKIYIENTDKFNYKLIFDLNYMHYLMINEELYIKQNKENQINFQNVSLPKIDNDFYFNIFIKSDINSHDNFVKLKI